MSLRIQKSVIEDTVFVSLDRVQQWAKHNGYKSRRTPGKVTVWMPLRKTIQFQDSWSNATIVGGDNLTKVVYEDRRF